VPATCGLLIVLNENLVAVARELTVNEPLEPVKSLVESVAVITSLVDAFVIVTEMVQTPLTNVPELVGLIEPEESLNTAVPA
jgi:hypothetical protein